MVPKRWQQVQHGDGPGEDKGNGALAERVAGGWGAGCGVPWAAGLSFLVSLSFMPLAAVLLATSVAHVVSSCTWWYLHLIRVQET